MASVDYAKKITDLLNDEGIDFVSYDANAPCVPQARPIEKYWALCKKEYKKLPHAIEEVREFRRA